MVYFRPCSCSRLSLRTCCVNVFAYRVPWTNISLSNVFSAFSAFPDSPQFDQGSQVHSFRIREQLQSLAAEHSKRPPTKDGFVYGYSHFTQKRDPSSKRGYCQVRCLIRREILELTYRISLKRSTVILTQLQYPALFTRIVSVFGPLYDLHGLPVLESACHTIATWCVSRISFVPSNLLHVSQRKGVTRRLGRP